MSKQDQASERQQVSFSLDSAELSHIDAFAKNSSTPWHTTSRAEVLRTFVRQGIARVHKLARRLRKKRPAMTK